jgi:hypothetical protein
VGARVEQAPGFLATEDVGELLGLLGRRDVKVGARMAEGDVIEEPEGVRGLRARAPGQLLRLEEVRQGRLDLVGGELVRRPVR